MSLWKRLTSQKRRIIYHLCEGPNQDSSVLFVAEVRREDMELLLILLYLGDTEEQIFKGI